MNDSGDMFTDTMFAPGNCLESCMNDSVDSLLDKAQGGKQTSQDWRK